MNTLIASCVMVFFMWFCLLPGSQAPGPEKRNDTAEKFLNFFLVKILIRSGEHGFQLLAIGNALWY